MGAGTGSTCSERQNLRLQRSDVLKSILELSSDQVQNLGKCTGLIGSKAPGFRAPLSIPEPPNPPFLSCSPALNDSPVINSFISYVFDLVILMHFRLCDESLLSKFCFLLPPTPPPHPTYTPKGLRLNRSKLSLQKVFTLGLADCSMGNQRKECFLPR